MIKDIGVTYILEKYQTTNYCIIDDKVIQIPNASKIHTQRMIK